MTLEMEGFVVESAAGGIEGLALWKSIQPELIFLDILMPDMSGLEVLEAMSGSGSKAKVILMSAYSGEELIPADISSLGANLFLQKPFEDIFKTVKQAIKTLEIN